MRSRSRKISIRTLALLTAALILLASGGVFTTRAALNIFGDNYDASLALGNIGVQMLENGSEVGDDSALFQNVGDTDKQGNRFFAPGKKYNDTISVQNTGNEPEYVRVIVRKYWTKGNDKQTALSPELIELSTDPDAWVKVSDMIAPSQELEMVDKKILSGIVGVKAASAFFQHLAAESLVSAEDVLLRFSKFEKRLLGYEIHQLAKVNESIFRYLENRELKSRKTVAKNLTSYVDILSARKESLAHFASIFNEGKHKKAVAFIVMDASTVYEKMTRFISAI